MHKKWLAALSQLVLIKFCCGHCTYISSSTIRSGCKQRTITTTYIIHSLKVGLVELTTILHLLVGLRHSGLHWVIREIVERKTVSGRRFSDALG